MVYCYVQWSVSMHTWSLIHDVTHVSHTLQIFFLLWFYFLTILKGVIFFLSWIILKFFLSYSFVFAFLERRPQTVSHLVLQHLKTCMSVLKIACHIVFDMALKVYYIAVKTTPFSPDNQILKYRLLTTIFHSRLPFATNLNHYPALIVPFWMHLCILFFLIIIIKMRHIQVYLMPIICLNVFIFVLNCVSRIHVHITLDFEKAKNK